MEKTAPERRLAVAADAEYRNRHPEEELEPLRSAEPEPVTSEERAAFWSAQDSTERDVGSERPGGERNEATEPHWAKDLAARLAQRKATGVRGDGHAGVQPQGDDRQEATAGGGPETERQDTAAEAAAGADKTPSGRGEPKPSPGQAEAPGWVKELTERAARAQEKLAERQAVQIPAEDPEAEGLGIAWPDLLDRERDPLLHPAELNMRPSAGVLAEAARQAGSQAEAGGPEAGG